MNRTVRVRKGYVVKKGTSVDLIVAIVTVIAVIVGAVVFAVYRLALSPRTLLRRITQRNPHSWAERHKRKAQTQSTTD